MRLVTYTMPEDLWRALKQVSAEADISMSKIVRVAVWDWMHQHGYRDLGEREVTP